jgi:hypothetical protein
VRGWRARGPPGPDNARCCTLRCMCVMCDCCVSLACVALTDSPPRVAEDFFAHTRIARQPCKSREIDARSGDVWGGSESSHSGAQSARVIQAAFILGPKTAKGHTLISYRIMPPTGIWIQYGDRGTRGAGCWERAVRDRPDATELYTDSGCFFLVR